MLHDITTVAPEALLQTLHNGGRLVMVSNGSLHPKLKLGTAARVIKAEGSPVKLQDHNIVPGSSDSQCSHRSELWGMIGVIQQLNNICSHQDIPTGAI